MTLRQLEDKVTIGPVLQGHFKVTIEFRGKVYTCTSTDTMASDAIRYGDNRRERKQAFQSLYNYCKFYNRLK